MGKMLIEIFYIFTFIKSKCHVFPFHLNERYSKELHLTKDTPQIQMHVSVVQNQHSVTSPIVALIKIWHFYSGKRVSLTLVHNTTLINRSNFLGIVGFNRLDIMQTKKDKLECKDRAEGLHADVSSGCQV